MTSIKTTQSNLSSSFQDLFVTAAGVKLISLATQQSYMKCMSVSQEEKVFKTAKCLFPNNRGFLVLQCVN